jgi:poly-gamma-glutamate synthesis protein (capsule biosynthesis protein)
MHPANLACLHIAAPDCCVLANNHVLDWGRAGLRETLDTLKEADVQTVGAGRDAAGAAASVRIELSGGRAVRLFAYASPDAGVPRDWSAGPKRPGVNLLPGYGRDARRHVVEHVRSHAQEDEVVVVSIHWGSNWGYRIPEEQRTFARALIDEAGVDIVHGHSSHHPRGIEVHGDRLILYGCGDFLNDYEGISGHDSFRPELTLMYLPELDAGTGALKSLTMVPMRISRLSLQRADRAAAEWLRDRLADHSSGLRFEVDDEARIRAAPARPTRE